MPATLSAQKMPSSAMRLTVFSETICPCSMHFTPASMAVAVDLLAAGRFDRTALVGDTVTLDSLDEGIGLLARAIQHEIDHLDGVLIVDRVSSLKKQLVKKEIKKDDKTIEREVSEYHAEGILSLKMGIRLYDNLNERIVDEEFYSKTRSWKENADSKARAFAKLIRKADASRAMASRLCRKYAYRIAPQPIRISRVFFFKNNKCPAIEKGTRYADVNNWEKAIEIWEDGMASAQQKEAGLLAYNIAVGYEVLGDFETALRWAQDAYTEYGNMRAQSYAATLQKRISSEQRVDEQMGTVE